MLNLERVRPRPFLPSPAHGGRARGGVLSMANPVQVRTLGNGLMVMTREVHDAPVATFWTWYRVGARNEVAGITGISHWVEHMMFKGTPQIAKGEIFRSVSKNGGTLNGFTWID